MGSINRKAQKADFLINQDKIKRFNQIALPHLNAVFNLAKWLTRNTQDAEDVVQESFVKAFYYFDSFKGEDGRAWLLAIVRNTSYTHLKMKCDFQMEPFDEKIHLQFANSSQLSPNPEELVFREIDCRLIDAAIETLPIEFREVLILRELEDLSYKEIAEIVGVPTGTVMSRLSRARGLLRNYLSSYSNSESTQ